MLYSLLGHLSHGGVDCVMCEKILYVSIYWRGMAEKLTQLPQVLEVL